MGTVFAVPHYSGYPLPEVIAALQQGAAGGSDAAAATAATAGAETAGAETAGVGLGGGGGGRGEGVGGGGGLGGLGREWMFQFYAPRMGGAADDERVDREYSERLLRWVAGLGCRAVMLTCDTVNNANRERT